MDFSDVAAYFDEDQAYDAYTLDPLFLCHTTPHDDHTSSGATARRRTLTAAPGTEPPARRAIRLYGEFWLVGNNNPDSFQGQLVRRSFGLKKSSGLMEALTPGQAALGSAGTSFHAHKEYFRDNQNARTEAEWDVMWNIFVPPDEPVAKGSFLRQGDTLFRVRAAYTSIEELLIAEADEFDADAEQSVTFTSSTLNVATDTMVATSIATTAVQTDVTKFYRFRTQAEADHKPGDRTVFVAKSAITPKVGSNMTMLGTTWRVMMLESENDAWALQVRRV